MPFKRLETREDMTTDELIAQIEQKDRRFRLFQTIFMVGTFLALIVVIVIQNQTLHGVEDQLTQQKTISEKADKTSQENQEKVLRRLDCMTVFFSQRERTNLTIQNIDQCTLDRDGDIMRFFTNDVGGGTTSTNTVQPEGQETPKVPAP